MTEDPDFLVGYYGLANLADATATALGIRDDEAKLANLHRALLAAYRRGRETAANPTRADRKEPR